MKTVKRPASNEENSLLIQYLQKIALKASFTISHKDFVFRTWSNSEASTNEIVRSALWVQFPYGNFQEI